MTEKPIKSEDKPINWVDQIAHGGIAFLIVLISAVPVISGIIGAFRFAVTREYYQAKEKTIEVFRLQGFAGKPKFYNIMKRMNWIKRDLVAAYAGIGFGIPVAFVVFYFVFQQLKEWF